LIFLSLSSPETKLKRERKKERKIWSGFDCLCCVYQLSLAGLVISLPLPCWYLANLFAFFFFVFNFFVLFLVFAVLLCRRNRQTCLLFFYPQTVPPVEYKRRRKKMKRESFVSSRVCVNSAGSDWALLLREPHPTSAPFIIKSR
jgi:hypothetical protein